MSGFGRNSDWLRNIETIGNEEVTIAGEHFRAAHRFLDEDEAVAVVKNYEHANRCMIPIVRSVLTRLLGWAYSGSDDDRRRLVRELPLLAFRPRS
jgi:hypothetical protein